MMLMTCCNRRLPLLLMAAVLFALAAAPRPAWAGYAAYVVDARSGFVLHSENADVLNYPASLTKMMTLYLVFESLDHGVISLNTQLPVSREAASRPPSKLGLKPGQTIRLRDAIRTLAAKSANDVAAVIAEYFSGTEENFARLMTKRARALGMSRTTFRNASGLPNREQRTTARDMATLSLAIYQRFPHHTHFFANRVVSYRGNKYRNTNRMLGSYRGMDGIKTGYIRASGYNLAASARRGGTHLIAILMGGTSSKGRNARMKTLLDHSFDNIGWIRKALTTVQRPQPKPEVVAARTVLRRLPEARIRQAVARTLSSGEWSIQVGAYLRYTNAEAALERAESVVPFLLQRAGRRIETFNAAEGRLYRARQTGLSESEAREACDIIKRHELPCAIALPVS